MKIRRILTSVGFGSYYCEDLSSLQENPVPLEERYYTKSKSSMFHYLREVGEALSIGLEIDNRGVFWGDCLTVAYAGKAGRDSVFRAKDSVEEVTRMISPILRGFDLESFRETVQFVGRQPLSLAVEYGLSQALLNATAAIRAITPVEVICEEWQLPLPEKRVALHAQSGSERYYTVDKMIARRIDSLPHGLVDDIPSQLGERGESLVSYVQWLKTRLDKVGDPAYQPTLHLDVHGAIGKLLQGDQEKIVALLLELEAAAAPRPLRMESVVIAQSRDTQIAALTQLKSRLRDRGSKIQLVADEWANTEKDIKAFADTEACDMVQVKMPDLGGIHHSIDAVLYCRKKGMQTLLGGTCNETDISSRLTAHIALATQPTIVMAKPGMGVDEGIMLIGNEMDRTLSTIRK